MSDLAAAADRQATDLRDQVGVTTSSFAAHLARDDQPGKFTLLDLPRIMRDELDMRVIDLNTSSLVSLEPVYLDRVRSAAAAGGCVLTNLKLNQPGLDMSSPDRATRQKAVAEYKRSIDAGQRLGVRWARPLPLKEQPEMELYLASFRELADYAQQRGIQMVVENYGWMDSDADSVPKLIRAIGRNVAAAPDTGNWANDMVRYLGLANAFPLAVTCDFKAREMGARGEHSHYDLRRCFQIGWDAGFRGPWCLEHAHRDRKQLFRELILLRDMLRSWIATHD